VLNFGVTAESLRDLDRYRASGYPAPINTILAFQLSVDRRLPSFLAERASEHGMIGYGSTNRISQFLYTPFECRKSIISCYVSNNLIDEHVATQLLRLSVKDLERFEGLWRCIEDTLFLSSPENFVRGSQTPIRRIFRWFVSAYLYQGHTGALNSYKEFVQFVKQKGSLSVDGERAKPFYFPWYDQATHELRVTGISWLDLIVERGVKTKDEAVRFMHFISLRGAPCPDRVTTARSLIEHQILRCSTPKPTNDDELRRLFLIGTAIGKRADRSQLARSVLSTEHLSVSNSSCYENPRSAGGRSKFVSERLRVWLQRIPQEDCQQRLILGDIINVKAGIPYWKSFTPVAPLSESEGDPKVVLGDTYEGDLLPRYAGFNKNVGYALLQWATECGVHEGTLDSDYKVIGTFRQRAVCLGEPGNKARSLTIDPAWVTIFLTPLGHLLVDTLRTIPEVSAGLGRGQPCFQFAERLAKQVARYPEQRVFFDYSWFLTMDLDKASDHFHQEKSRFLLRGYLHGLGKDFENLYCLEAIKLLCQPRECMWSL